MGVAGCRWLRDGERVPAGMKWCSRCQAVKSVTEFFKNRSRRDGLSTYCKPCAVVDRRRRIEAQPGGRSAEGRRRRYGIEHDEFEALWLSQEGRCAACGDELVRGGRTTHLDHCHVTGKVRGILCITCNLALGYLKDDVERITRLREYLARFSGTGH